MCTCNAYVRVRIFMCVHVSKIPYTRTECIDWFYVPRLCIRHAYHQLQHANETSTAQQRKTDLVETSVGCAKAPGEGIPQLHRVVFASGKEHTGRRVSAAHHRRPAKIVHTLAYVHRQGRRGGWGCRNHRWRGHCGCCRVVVMLKESQDIVVAACEETQTIRRPLHTL